MIFIPQHDKKDCGSACLAMISNFYGKKYSLQYLRDISFVSREGVSLLGLSEASREIGFEPLSAQLSIEQLEKMPLPCILHWNKKHFVVLYKVRKRGFGKKKSYSIADPRHGLISLHGENFRKCWTPKDDEGIALFLSPTERFYGYNAAKENKLNIQHLFNYLRPHKKRILIMFMLLFLGSVITFIFPFLTQNLIDKGVNAKNLHIIELILLAQLGLFLGAMSIEFIRNWLMLYVGTRINIAIISDFLQKVFKLPIRFFETKVTGDFNQRIQDHERIENFLTSQSLITLFSIVTFTAFFSVLWYYSVILLLVYLVLTVLSVGWSYYFLRKRRILDYYRFQQRSENQESIYEIITGVTEMKLNQFESLKHKEWKRIQEKLFKINVRILKLNQLQLIGFESLNQLKNILVTFLAATYVVKGSMTLGELLGISFIIGQMNAPINQLISFFRSLQDAKLSLERLNEVQHHKEEEQPGLQKLNVHNGGDPEQANGCHAGIKLNNVSFQYEGPRSPYVLKNIDLFIPEGKTTAIVGASGSGKTSLIKLLLKFYDPTEGQIFINGINLVDLSPTSLRENCGVVMQDGFIFSDTIERNIATADEQVEQLKLDKAAKTASISDFIQSLPLKYETKIGSSGNGISGGQKQRILISRAVYKDPHYIFFDEATSALDAENEKIIHQNLQEFFKGKTVLIVAHRLSTVKNADQIIVLSKGRVVERGTHTELVNNKREYFNLVKNQLELGY
jgi:ATP-binding cassette subfamily B protein